MKKHEPNANLTVKIMSPLKYSASPVFILSLAGCLTITQYQINSRYYMHPWQVAKKASIQVQ